jgi:hypothetical protein
LAKKREEDEHSEGYEDEDNQNVPNEKGKATRRSDKVK